MWMEVKDFYKLYEKNSKLFVQTVGQGAGEPQGSGKQTRKLDHYLPSEHLELPQCPASEENEGNSMISKENE